MGKFFTQLRSIYRTTSQESEWVKHGWRDKQPAQRKTCNVIYKVQYMWEKHFNLIKTLSTANVGKLSLCDSPPQPLFKIHYELC